MSEKLTESLSVALPEWDKSVDRLDSVYQQKRNQDTVRKDNGSTVAIFLKFTVYLL